MTGISVDTLRAWERRYKVVSPARSTRGRLYSSDDVQRFIQLRAALGKGYAIGEVAGLSGVELDALAVVQHEAKSTGPANGDSVSASRINSILSAVEELNGDQVNEELGRLASLLSPTDFVHQVAIPVMREAGDRWHAGTLQVAHEHLVTESVRNLLGTMVRLNRPGDEQPKILATTPAGELHELGVLAGAMLAGVRGFSVVSLGSNLPADQILFVAEKTGAEVVLLGMTTPDPSQVSLEAVQALAAGLHGDTELWLGGSGASRVALPENPRVVLLEDFDALDRHLSRIRTKSSRGLQ